jgi:hypothetical protein
MADIRVNTGGPSLCSLVFIVFLVLKLCSVINWSWWWITAPLWGGLALFLAFLLIMLAIGLVGVLGICIVAMFE